MQQLIDRLSLVMREALSGMMVVHRICRPSRSSARPGEPRADRWLNLFVNRVMPACPRHDADRGTLSLAITWLGAPRGGPGADAGGDVMAFVCCDADRLFAPTIPMAFISSWLRRLGTRHVCWRPSLDPRSPAAVRAFPEPFRAW